MSTEGFEAPALLGHILESVSDFILFVDRSGAIRYINRVEQGYDREKVIGMPARTFMVGDSPAGFDEAFASVLATGEPKEYDVEVEHPDGARSWYRSRMTRIAAGAEFDGVVIVATDVTELKEAEAKVLRLRKLLPLCAWCDRIRDDGGEWTSIESYLARSSGRELTHGICDRCSQSMEDAERGG